MAGGSGERFWPLSRRNRPKQLLDLSGSGKSMLEESIARLRGLCRAEDVYVATAPHLLSPIRKKHIGIDDSNVIAEPHKRNTAGCLVWFVANMLAQDEQNAEAEMLVVTADHSVRPKEGFQDTVNALLEGAGKERSLGVIGIRPTRAETGFGYVECGEKLGSNPQNVAIYKALRFREKPDAITAQSFVDAGNFFWNSGMFFWRVQVFLDELEKAAPIYRKAIDEIADELRGNHEQSASRLFEKLPNESIDYALMEKSENVLVAQANFEWDDLGSWDSLDRIAPLDADANATLGDTLLMRSSGSIVCNRSERQKVCVVGMDDVIVVTVDDIVLICPKAEAQSVRELVAELRERHPDLL